MEYFYSMKNNMGSIGSFQYDLFYNKTSNTEVKLLLYVLCKDSSMEYYYDNSGEVMKKFVSTYYKGNCINRLQGVKAHLFLWLAVFSILKGGTTSQ